MSFAITGIKDGLGQEGPNSVPLRRELRDLQANYPDQWNLYILGLTKLQDPQYLAQTERLSYYQICGIHGRPYVPWDGVRDTESGNAATTVGYCTHASVYFPTWHRAYLALFEQGLYAAVQVVVNEFPAGPLRAKYAKAAQDLRLPYWDWAQLPAPGRSELPFAVGGFDGNSWNHDTIRVITAKNPNGTTIKNPLFSYVFKPLSARDFGNQRPWTVFPSTLRHATSGRPDATSKNQDVNLAIRNSQESLRESLYTLVMEYEQYLDFSNTRFHSGNPNRYDSLEDLHNGIHVSIGGQGHMTVPDFAAFDPIFWLHHCAVDRVFALWQALHPNSYFESTQESGDSALLPFHKDTKNAWVSSNNVRGPKSFGYTYPDLVDWKFSTQEEFTDALKDRIFRLYVNQPGSSGNAPSAQSFDGPGDQQPIPASGGNTVAPTSLGSINEQFRRWTVNIRVKKYCLFGSFSVHVFIGDFTEDPTGWVFDPNLVGSYSVFANDPRETSCSKCVGDFDNELIVTGTVPIYRALVAAKGKGLVESLEPEHVVPFLTKNLHWRVQKPDNEAIHRDAEDLTSLKVSVVSAVVRPPQGPGQLPTQLEAEVHFDITDSRPAGLQPGDQV
ncbi:MAG: hypothetical protein M1814_001821 [Vezdaea aestivalis]|nr:MAG: hypothetical protein M1814_001821 [Vezdaea aestivalis]